MKPLETIEPLAHADERCDEPPDRFRGPFFDSRTAAAYVPCKTVKGWYEWRRRHGVAVRANGSVAKVDLDRALKLRGKRPRKMAATSLANLRKRKVS